MHGLAHEARQKSTQLRRGFHNNNNNTSYLHDFQTAANAARGGCHQVYFVLACNNENFIFFFHIHHHQLTFLFCIRRKMSVFAGPVDKHRSVVISSTATEEHDSAEFGPKLSSKFFAFLSCCFSRTLRRPVRWFPNTPPTSISNRSAAPVIHALRICFPVPSTRWFLEPLQRDPSNFVYSVGNV